MKKRGQTSIPGPYTARLIKLMWCLFYNARIIAFLRSHKGWLIVESFYSKFTFFLNKVVTKEARIRFLIYPAPESTFKLTTEVNLQAQTCSQTSPQDGKTLLDNESCLIKATANDVLIGGKGSKKNNKDKPISDLSHCLEGKKNRFRNLRPTTRSSGSTWSWTTTRILENQLIRYAAGKSRFTPTPFNWQS